MFTLSLTILHLSSLSCSAGKDRFVGSLYANFPQSIHGTMFANPTLYTQIPLRLDATPDTDVSVYLNDERYPAEEVSTGTYLVNIPIGDLPDETYALRASVSNVVLESAHQLVISRSGLSFEPSVATTNALYPTLGYHRDRLYLTWLSADEETGRVWLQEIDGGGRAINAPSALTDEETHVLRSRTTFGGSYIATLLQDLTLETQLQIKTIAGSDVIEPISLGPTTERFGDIDSDDQSFMATWSAVNTDSNSNLQWLTVQPSVQEILGPSEIVLPSEQNEILSPLGTIIGVLSPEHSVINVVTTSLEAPEESTNRLMFIDEDGVVQREETAAHALSSEVTANTTHYVADQFLALWVEKSDDRHQVLGTLLSAQMATDSQENSSAELFSSDTPISHLTIIDHTERFASLLWVNSSDVEELYVTDLDAELSVGSQQHIFYADVSSEAPSLDSIQLGTNVLIVWTNRTVSEEDTADLTLHFETLWY